MRKNAPIIEHTVVMINKGNNFLISRVEKVALKPSTEPK